MKKLFLTSWITLVICLFNSYSQSGMPPSPNSAALGNYAASPVGLYTGVPEINIPLYTLTSRQLSVPVSLSYHGGGIKVEEIASDVGLGWSLNAGGCITRQVRARPDEDANGFLYLGGGNINSPNYLYDGYDLGQEDGEPDIFYFNFLGRAGTFVFKPDMTYYITPIQDIIITPTIVNHQITQFVITTEDGTKFTFSDCELTQAAMHVEYVNFQLTSPNYNSAWYLSKIESADGTDVIHFSYKYLSTYTVALLNSEVLHYPFADPADPSQYHKIDYDPQNTTVPYNYSYFTDESNSYSISGCVLDKIWTYNYGIIFSYGTPRCDLSYYYNTNDPPNMYNDRSLYEIKIYYKPNDNPYFYNNTSGITNYCIKRFRLAHTYSNASATGISESDPSCVPGSGQTAYRLMLESVTETDGPGTSTLPPYTFTYDSQTLPDRSTSRDVDYWGYYNMVNGGGSNTTLIPQCNFNDYFGSAQTIPRSISGYYCNRVPCSSATARSLVKITYPTGGYTQYNYELNTCQSSLLPYGYITGSSTDKYAGGLRVSGIVTSDGAGNTITKSYNYKYSTNTSSGKLTGFFNFGHLEIAGDKDVNTGIYTYYNYYVIRSSSSYPLSTTYGSTVGYESVTVDEGNNGKTVSWFYTPADYPDVYETMDLELGDYVTFTSDDVLLSSEYVPAYSADWRRGNLKEVDVKDKNNNWIAKKLYTYQDDGPATMFKCRAQGENMVLVPTQYLLNKNEKCYRTRINYISRLKTLDDFTYDPANSSIIAQKTTTYNYDGPTNHHMPIYIKTTNGQGGFNILKNKYVIDYSSTIADLNYMQTHHIISPVVEQQNYIIKPDGSSYLIGGTIKNYGESYNLTKPFQVYSLETAAPIASTDYTYSNSYQSIIPNPNNYYNLKASFSYNSTNNLVSLTPANGNKKTTIWGYNSTFPVADVINEIFSDDFENVNTWSNWYNPYSCGTDPCSQCTCSASYVSPPQSSGPYSCGGKQMLKVTNSTSPGHEIYFYTNDCAVHNPVTRKYRASCWVYFDPGAGSFSADLYIFYNLTTTPHHYDGNQFVNTTTPGWVYLEVDIDVPANAQSVFARIDNNIAGGVPLFFDDVHIYPVDGLIAKYTYDNFGNVSSVTDANKKTTYYEYDNFGRLIRVKDENNNILEKRGYNFAH